MVIQPEVACLMNKLAKSKDLKAMLVFQSAPVSSRKPAQLITQKVTPLKANVSSKPPQERNSAPLSVLVSLPVNAQPVLLARLFKVLDFACIQPVRKPSVTSSPSLDRRLNYDFVMMYLH